MLNNEFDRGEINSFPGITHLCLVSFKNLIFFLLYLVLILDNIHAWLMALTFHIVNLFFLSNYWRNVNICRMVTVKFQNPMAWRGFSGFMPNLISIGQKLWPPCGNTQTNRHTHIQLYRLMFRCVVILSHAFF